MPDYNCDCCQERPAVYPIRQEGDKAVICKPCFDFVGSDDLWSIIKAVRAHTAARQKEYWREADTGAGLKRPPPSEYWKER
jgi:hypothetical protein